MRRIRSVGWGLVVLGAVAIVGCAQQQTKVPFSPQPVPRPAHFDYKPLDLTPKAPPPAPVQPAPKPEVQIEPAPPAPPPLPWHEASWEPDTPKRDWKWIVIHHSASARGSASIIDEWHRKGNHWDELGYHFVIGNGSDSGDGQIEVGSRWPKQKHGAHCKVGNDETYNETGIGICLVGNFEKTHPSPAQMAALARLVDFLAARYQIDDRHIIGHGGVGETRCPGRYFSLSDLLARLHAERQARGDEGIPGSAPSRVN